MNDQSTIKTPLTGAYSSTKGFVVYRGKNVVYQVTDPLEAMHVAARLLMMPQMVDGELVKGVHRRVLWSKYLLELAGQVVGD